MKYIATPHGPLVEGASPELLRELLEQYEEKLVALGAPVRETMLPGIGRDEVESKLALRGLACPDEIAVWFGWHNGYNRAGMRHPGIPLIFNASLDRSLKAYDDSTREFALAWEKGINYASLAYGATEGWLRLQGISDAIAVECVNPGAEPPRVIFANSEFTDPDAQHL